MSIFLLACFVLVSASVSYVSGFAHASDHNASQLQTLFTEGVEGLHNPAGGSNPEEAAKDKCSCKEKSGATKFVCSVTLAFCGDSVVLHSPAPSKTRFVLSKVTAPQSFIDELKRPPRTIL